MGKVLGIAAIAIGLLIWFNSGDNGPYGSAAQRAETSRFVRECLAHGGNVIFAPNPDDNICDQTEK